MACLILRRPLFWSASCIARGSAQRSCIPPAPANGALALRCLPCGEWAGRSGTSLHLPVLRNEISSGWDARQCGSYQAGIAHKIIDAAQEEAIEGPGAAGSSGGCHGWQRLCLARFQRQFLELISALLETNSGTQNGAES